MHRKIVTITMAMGMILAMLAGAGCTQRQDQKAQNKPEPEAPFVPSPQFAVDKMLEMAQVKKDDLLYDLGCGDGRIVVTAAKKYGCKAVGFDINPDRVKESLENVRKNQVQHLVKIVQQDIFELDLSKPDVVTLYLMPEVNERLIPQLKKLKPGSRIVSHDFGLGSIEPDETVYIRAPDRQSASLIYLWTTPFKEEEPLKKEGIK